MNQAFIKVYLFIFYKIINKEKLFIIKGRDMVDLPEVKGVIIKDNE